LISALLIVLPIFALIFAGWGAGRVGFLGSSASAELNKFVIWLAVPALLFDVIGSAELHELEQLGFIGAFGLSTLLMYALAMAVGFKVTKNIADAAIDGLNAAYSNIGFVGLPLLVIVLGRSSIIFTTLGMLVTMCLVFATAIVIVELSQQAHVGLGKTVIEAAKTLMRNPILLSSAVALPFPYFNWTIPAPAKTFLEMLGAAASPCALVALGLFLSLPRSSRKPKRPFISFLIFAKLVLHPVLAWSIATFVFVLERPEVVAATLLAALPCGTGSFMLAGFYKRDPTTTTAVIIASTIISIFSLSLLIAVQHGYHWSSPHLAGQFSY
jgi:predicted permease